MVSAVRMNYITVSILLVVLLLLVESCVHNGVTYQPGEEYQESPCKTCECGHDGWPICFSRSCGQPSCGPFQTPVVKAGDCCASCP
ncbi:unnamed protein product [Lymnaea stagnalis]|uniref:VWFC domain-containing protein n=1 Tax=Lymnaea stagnalis TaxID=6523 RepID=A0AAV2HNB7_LYMST